ncbi:serine hydrolase [Gracilimonas tropica]|uniref:serine hydrolase n=1 Tax=Gracilimonas tropica TaxID=454600 RepID=UPI000360D908|nr:serine hydrolase [Gracilimonas tropica]
MKLFNTVLLIFLLAGNIALAQTESSYQKPIKSGDEILGELQAESVHSYQLDISDGQYVFGKADQRSVDVVVTIKDPAGNVIGTFDGPARGREAFQFVSEASGVYTIEVRSFEGAAGQYSIQVVKVEPEAKDPEGKVDQLMSEYAGDVPGAAVMVMKDGKVELEKYYGRSNLAYEVEMNPGSVHNIGSTSKQFLAFGLLLLQEEGKLNLSDDIRKYIPELPEFEEVVTVRNIVNHTSGYREFVNLLAMTGRNLSSPVSQEMIIEIVQRQPELQNMPGAEFNYNNTGYALATEVIERVTEETFPNWMKDNVFKPIGMEHTSVRWNPHQIIENRTLGYQFGEDGQLQEVTDLGGAMGAGGIHSTLHDLSLWVDNLLDPKVGTKAMIEEMTTSFTLINGSKTGYGLGLFIDEYNGLKRIHHGGADMAHRSNLMVFPEINAAVITQSNFGGFRGDIGNKIAEIYFSDAMKEPAEQEEVTEEREPEEFVYDPEQFDLLTGRYELSIMPGFILSFSRDDDRLYTQATGQPEVNIRATSDSTFDLVGVPAGITFHLNEDGTADSLTLHQNGNHIARKIKFELSYEGMEEYIGRYYSEEIETVYKVVIADSSLKIRHYQMEDGLTLEPGAPDNFGAEFPLAEVQFIRDEKGNITGFTASNGRARGILFTKWEP